MLKQIKSPLKPLKFSVDSNLNKKKDLRHAAQTRCVNFIVVVAFFAILIEGCTILMRLQKPVYTQIYLQKKKKL